MTLLPTRRGLLITELSLTEMALLCHALPLTDDTLRVLTALLEGQRVAVTPEAFPHRRYRRTAPLSVYRTFAAMERQLHEIGLARAGKGDTP